MLVKLSIKIFSEINNLFIKQILLFVLIFFTVFFYSCSDNPSSIGAALLSGDQLKVNELDSYKDTLSQKSSYLKRAIKLGSAYRLFVGKAENIEASSLMNFYMPLEDSVKNIINADSITIVSARVYLWHVYNFGDSTGNYDFTVHQILSGWTSVNFNSDSLSVLSYDAADISSEKILSDTLDEFSVSPSLALSWLKYSSDSVGNNYGIYIQPSQSSQKVVGYQALYSTTHDPYISIVYQRLGYSNNDTLTFLANADVSAVTGDIPTVTQSSIIVQGGLAINAKLWFDVSKIPFNANINNAKVTLNLNSAKSIIGDTTNTILGFFVQDSSSIVLDSTLSPIIFDASYTGDITSYVQKWVSSRTNEGILLTTSGDANNVDLFTFTGSNAADSSKPRLHIIYTTKK